MARSVIIIDYGAGNVRSVAKAFEYAISESSLTDTVRVSALPEEVHNADRLVLPGVGAFGDCRRGLLTVPGLIEALTDTVLTKGRPFLGICVGMQLMATVSLENGEYAGLNWIGGPVVPIQAPTPAMKVKVPHMGWNDLIALTAHPLLTGLPEQPHVYFVHSYHFIPTNPEHRLAIVYYGETITAIVCRDNMVGTQFHPEKSQAVGLTFISNFLHWSP